MFSYVKNNPILYVDPSGYVGFFASMAIGIAVEAALTLGFPMLKVIPFLIDILAELITMVIINVLNKLEALYGITPETIITIAITAVAGGLALGFLAKKIGPLLSGKTMKDAAEEGIEAINNTAKKQATLAVNKAKGKLAEDNVTKALNKIYGEKNVYKQVTVITDAGRRRLDNIVDVGGKYIGIEVKSGNAVRSSTQLLKDEIISRTGGIFVGKNAPNALKTGVPMIIEIFEIIY